MTNQELIGSVLGHVVLVQHIDELRERGRDPHAGLVLDPLDPLFQNLLDHHGEVFFFSLSFRFVKVHIDRNERRLAVRGHQRHNLVLDRLYALLDLGAHAVLHHVRDLLFRHLNAVFLDRFEHVLTDALTADLHERSQMGKRNALSAILAAGHLRHDLRRHVAGRAETVGLFDPRSRDHGSVLQHILKIHKVAVMHVLREVVRIVEMDDPILMRFHDLRRKKETLGNVLADLAGHIITLYGVHRGILIGIFLLDLFIIAFDQRQDLLIRGIALSDQGSFIPISNVCPRDFIRLMIHDVVFHQILDLLDGQRPRAFLALLFDRISDRKDLVRMKPVRLLHLSVGFVDSGQDL